MKYVDLFSGCGGLSYGLRRSGWELCLAVEKSPMAAETYWWNFIKSSKASSWSDYLSLTPNEQVEQGLLVGEVSTALKTPSVMKTIRESGVDLVVGGPPCQGFSLAGRRDAEDSRNELAWDFMDFVAEVKPKFVVMENVLGMNAKFNQSEESSVYDRLALALGSALVDSSGISTPYKVQKVLANAFHYGAPQSRPRLLLIGMRDDLAKTAEINPDNDVWRSDFLDIITRDYGANLPDLVPRTISSSESATVRNALGDFIDGKSTKYLMNLASMPLGLAKAPDRPANHVKRTHSLETVRKFSLYHLVANYNLPSILLRVPKAPLEEAQRSEELQKLKDLLVFPLNGDGIPDALKGFDWADLVKAFDQAQTRKHSQRILMLDSPSPTVVTAADDLLHPVEPRVLTVRELARLQGFPDGFEFRSKETTGGLKRRQEVPQYSQVGNAVSPFVSYAIGMRLAELFSGD